MGHSNLWTSDLDSVSRQLSVTFQPLTLRKRYSKSLTYNTKTTSRHEGGGETNVLAWDCFTHSFKSLFFTIFGELTTIALSQKLNSDIGDLFSSALTSSQHGRPSMYLQLFFFETWWIAFLSLSNNNPIRPPDCSWRITRSPRAMR